MCFKVYNPTYGTIPPHLPEPSRIKLKVLPCEGGSDVEYFNERLYIISEKNGGVFRIVNPKYPEKEIASIAKLGNLRQIEIGKVHNRIIAAITAREYGMYLIDVTNEKKPFIACHYDSVEFATGVTFCENYVFIACRSFGVEVIDISVPEHPRHVSIIRAGEVQSIKIKNGILFTGSWGEREVNIIDVRNVKRPKLLSTVKIDGRADGVYIRGNLLFVAFGHHLSPYRGESPDEYGYGRGNGFAIFDISELSRPKMLSSTLFKHRFYCYAKDMWDIQVSGKYAILSHTFNGVWIYDITNPTKPELCDYVGIKTEKKLRDFITLNDDIMNLRPTILPFDPNVCVYAPVRGVAVGNGKIWIVADGSNLCEAEGQYFIQEEEICEIPVAEENADFYVMHPSVNLPVGARIVGNIGQTHAAAVLGNRVYVACGNEGIKCFNEDLSEELFTFLTDDYVVDLHAANGRIIAAVSGAGVYIFSPTEKSLETVGKFVDEGMTFLQAVPAGEFIMAQAGCQNLYIIDAHNEECPILAMHEFYTPGLLYYRQITEQGTGNGCFGCFWNGNVTHWYALSGKTPKKLIHTQGRLDFACGHIGLPEPNKALAVCNGGYVIYDIREDLKFSDLEIITVPDLDFTGKPYLVGNCLVVNDRLSGCVTFLDISNKERPKLIRQIKFSGHPDMVCVNGENVYIPLGHQGICVVKIHQK